MQIVIVAGGKGTRLASRISQLPKALVSVGGKPLLEHQICLAAKHGFRDIVLLLGHQSAAIQEFAGDGSRWGVAIRSFIESQPLGSAGSVLAALPVLDSRFVVMYGDTMLNVDLCRFWRSHAEHQADFSIFVHPNDHPADSDLVETDDMDRIAAFHPYPHKPGRDYENLVNAALYIAEQKALLPFVQPGTSLDFGKDILPLMLTKGCNLYPYRSPEYIKDAGTPERLDAVERDYQSGRIDCGSLETPAPAVFLDRDGTINIEVDRVKTPDDIIAIPGAAAGIAALNRAGFRVVVITNQPVIARGDCTEAGLRRIHNRMETILGYDGAYIDRVYFCPHHPHRGFAGERAELKVSCICRKPAIGLIQRASRDLNIDLNRSWMVGDSTTDLQTARNAGIRAVLVRTGHAGNDGQYGGLPDFAAADLGEAATFIIGATLQK
jgi:histidinol-phosphate phosphatase family protein